MDNLYYLFITHLIVIISAIIFVLFIAYKIIKKSKFVKQDYLLVVILLICMYMYVPFSFYKKGLENNYAENHLEALKDYNTAYKLSLLPQEKRIFKYDSAIINYFYNKDGNKALEEMEYALNGNYSHPVFLQHLYFLKGNYDKVKEIEARQNNPTYYYTALSYVMQDQYEAALSLLLAKEQKSYNNFMLISALYKAINEPENADKYYQTAINEFNNLRFNDSSSEETKKNQLMDYSSIDTFKQSVENQRKEYKL